MKSHNEESGATGVQNGHAARESHSYGSTQGIHIHHNYENFVANTSFIIQSYRELYVLQPKMAYFG